jgi:hypothetical protein
VAGLLAWVSLFLPWWHISGLGPPITVSPVLLLTLERGEGAGAGLIQLSEGFYGLVVISFAFILLGGLTGVLRGFIRKKLVPLVAGVLVLSSMNMLTYAFVYLKIAGAVLCLTPTLFGAPIGYGISYGFVLAGISGVVILLSALYEI